MKPLIIIPNKAKVSKLEAFIDEFHFASTVSGWMNRDIFYLWTILFICEVAVYRLTLPEEIRYKQIILLVDGHSSRGNYYASKLLSIFGVLLLVFPGHTSHVLQPFDVGIAAALKTCYSKLIQKYKLKIEDEEIHIMNLSKMTTEE